MAEDEARFGLINWHKRRYCPQGLRPPWIVRREYQWTWLYAAVEPLTGESFCLYLPNLDAVCYESFLVELSNYYPNDQLILLRDNAPAHIKHDLEIPSNISPLALPPYSPELNPVERWFLEFRRSLANQQFDSIDQLEAALTIVLQGYWSNPEKLRQLTNYPWWQQAIDQL